MPLETRQRIKRLVEGFPNVVLSNSKGIRNTALNRNKEYFGNVIPRLVIRRVTPSLSKIPDPCSVLGFLMFDTCGCVIDLDGLVTITGSSY